MDGDTYDAWYAAMTPDARSRWDEWYAERPPAVKALIREFPPNIELRIGDDRFYILGCTEGNHVIVSEIDPTVDYEGACAARTYICADHLRQALVAVS